jgi:hypothetical protein
LIIPSSIQSLPSLIQFRTIFGTYVSTAPDKDTLLANATTIGKHQIFTKFYPNVMISIRLARNPSPFLSVLPSGDVMACSNVIRDQEQFQIRKLTGSVVAIKSCLLLRDLAVCDKGRVKAEVLENVKSSKAQR